MHGEIPFASCRAEDASAGDDLAGGISGTSRVKPLAPLVFS